MTTSAPQVMHLAAGAGHVANALFLYSVRTHQDVRPLAERLARTTPHGFRL